MFRKFISILLLSFSLVWPVLAQEDSAIQITHLPYLQGLADNEVTIVWTTNKPAIAWVEVAPDDSSHFYQQARPKVFAAAYGFKQVGTVHKVLLQNLKAGTKYRYRVYSQEVLQHVGVQVTYGKVVATDVYKQKPLAFKTLGPGARSQFAIINDIHGQNELMHKLLDKADLDQMDFVVFNGDMANSLLSESQMFADFMDTGIKRFASEKPLYYARGNHETRGPFAVEYPNYFPTPTGKLYYQFKHANAAFIVLDCGEDKPDSDIEYSGIVDMDNYRSEQAAWLERAVEDPAYKSAKYKIIICHMPPFGGWHGEEEILKKFVPILNRAGAQIMLSGHLHKHIIKAADSQVKFPIIVNANNHLIKVDLNNDQGLFSIIDVNGTLVDQVLLKPLH